MGIFEGKGKTKSKEKWEKKPTKLMWKCWKCDFERWNRMNQNQNNYHERNFGSESVSLNGKWQHVHNINSSSSAGTTKSICNTNKKTHTIPNISIRIFEISVEKNR